MARFSPNNLPKPRSDILRTIGAILYAAGSLAIVVAFLILLLPLLSLILAVAVGVALGVALTAGLWWIFRGRKLWRQMRRNMGGEAASPAPGDRPRKKIKATIRKDD